MSKHIPRSCQGFSQRPKFKAFWTFIASELGSSQLSLNDSATRLDELFLTSSSHTKFLKDLIKGSLKNPGGNLDQSIDMHQLLDSLGATAYSLRAEENDDLFDIELLEEIAWLISTHYSHCFATKLNKDKSNQQAKKHKTTAQLIFIKDYLIARRNRKV